MIVVVLLAAAFEFSPSGIYSTRTIHHTCDSDRRAIALAAADADDKPSEPAAAADAASAFMQKPRASSGKEAFDGSTWSVLMKMTEGGSTIFTMQLLEDETCRFSDSEAFGSWESDGKWVVVEKPKGFFDMTLYLSAKLEPPGGGKPKWRLIEGIVQQANATRPSAGPLDAEAAAADAEAAAAAADEVVDLGGGDDGEGDGETVELRQIGTFGANEFEESLLETMGRFAKDDEPPSESEGPDGMQIDENLDGLG